MQNKYINLTNKTIHTTIRLTHPHLHLIKLKHWHLLLFLMALSRTNDLQYFSLFERELRKAENTNELEEE